MAEPPDPHTDESMVGQHGAADEHGETNGHDDHAHGVETLGPIDVPRWASAAVGILLGLFVVLALTKAAF